VCDSLVATPGKIKPQPERKILKNGENPEIRKMRHKEQKCEKSEFLKNASRQTWKNESQPKRNKIENKTAQAKGLCEEAVLLLACVSLDEQEYD